MSNEAFPFGVAKEVPIRTDNPALWKLFVQLVLQKIAVLNTVQIWHFRNWLCARDCPCLFHPCLLSLFYADVEEYMHEEVPQDKLVLACILHMQMA